MPLAFSWILISDKFGHQSIEIRSPDQRICRFWGNPYPWRDRSYWTLCSLIEKMVPKVPLPVSQSLYSWSPGTRSATTDGSSQIVSGIGTNRGLIARLDISIDPYPGVRSLRRRGRRRRPIPNPASRNSMTTIGTPLGVFWWMGVVLAP